MAKEVHTFKLNINYEKVDQYIGHIKKGKFHYFVFEYNFQFNKEIFNIDGDLITSIYTLGKHYEDGKDDFFFDDGGNYFLDLKFINNEKILIGISETKPNEHIKEYVINKDIFITSLIKSIVVFINYIEERIPKKKIPYKSELKDNIKKIIEQNNIKLKEGFKNE